MRYEFITIFFFKLSISKNTLRTKKKHCRRHVCIVIPTMVTAIAEKRNNMLFYLLMSVNENLKTKARGIVSFFVELESIKMCTLGLEVKGKVN